MRVAIGSLPDPVSENAAADLGSIGCENRSESLSVRGTPVAPSAGDAALTCGGLLSAAGTASWTNDSSAGSNTSLA
jgi:hypothetical protein